MLLEVTNQIWKSMARLLVFLLLMSVKNLFGFFYFSYENKSKFLQIEYIILLKWQIMHFILEEHNWNKREKSKLKYRPN